MQQWLGKSVIILLDCGGATSVGTLMSYDDETFTVQETAGLHTYASMRLWDIKAGS